MEVDWKGLVRGVSPILGGLLGGPLAAGATKVLADIILGGSSGDSAKDEEALNTAMAGGLTPELKSQILGAEQATKQALIAADVQKTVIAADLEKSYITDIADARAHNANTVGVLRLGYLVNLASYSLIAAILFGVYKAVQGNGLDSINPTTLAVVSTLLGGIVQWLMSNCGQANGFFFGSSPSARASTAALADSVANTASKLSKKA